MTDADRFLEKVSPEPTSGCWLWAGYADPPRHRYGCRPRFRMLGKMLAATRAAWTIFLGPIPSGMKVLHRCDTSACVNPDHLFLGTQSDNMRDCASKGRVTIRLGEEHPGCRVSNEDVAAIRAAYADGGVSQDQLAESFGISQSQISRIIRWVNRGTNPPQGGRAWAS